MASSVFKFPLIGMIALMSIFGGFPSMAQIQAQLPHKDEVPAGKALPIDGVWMISTIGKRVRIERGRGYAVDSWLHLFLFSIQPGMVVNLNIKQTATGTFTVDDLPLQGPGTLKLTPEGNLDVTVDGALGPVAFQLIRQQVDDPEALQAEIDAVTGSSANAKPSLRITSPNDDSSSSDRAAPSGQERPASGDAVSLAKCKELGVDTKTGGVICLDN
jgi:hypothetical protein